MSVRSHRPAAPLPATEQVQIQVRVMPELRDRLREEADRRAVSINLLVERAIIEWLDKWEGKSLF